MNIEPGSRDIAAAAKMLREVREACGQFLALWAVERMTQEPRVMDRVAEDVEKARVERELSDPFNRDWSLLYRGSILDD